MVTVSVWSAIRYSKSKTPRLYTEIIGGSIARLGSASNTVIPQGLQTESYEFMVLENIRILNELET